MMLFTMLIMSLTLWFGDSLGSQVQGLICVVAILIFIFGFAIGLGAVTWVGKLLSIVGAVYIMCEFVRCVFIYLRIHICNYMYIYVYICICIYMYIFV